MRFFYATCMWAALGLIIAGVALVVMDKLIPALVCWLCSFLVIVLAQIEGRS